MDQIKCKCGREAAFQSVDMRWVEKKLESFGWRKIDGKMECPACCGTTGQELKILRNLPEDWNDGN